MPCLAVCDDKKDVATQPVKHEKNSPSTSPKFAQNREKTNEV